VGATFTEAVTAPPAARTLAVTYDDAFASVGELAAPILADLGLPGTVFVPTDWPGRTMHWPGIDQWLGTEHEHELRAMGWDELRALDRAGWEVAAHTCSHPHLTQVADNEALRHELADSRAACERELGKPCRSIAYPFGDVDERVRAATGAAGYEVGAALSATAFAHPSRLGVPRVGVWHGDGDLRFRAKVSPLTLRLLASPRLAALDAARRRRVRRRTAST
jgi:peptidoglycan/xylan/chitin deacetylase (PgdA/CDA1 family)